MHHELAVWSRGIIMDNKARDVSSCVAVATRTLGYHAHNVSDCVDDPDRANRLVRRYARIGDSPIDYLAMPGRFGYMRPEHIASIQVQANRNRRDRGMDVPAEIREGEDPARHLHLREETHSMPLNRGVGG